VKIFKTICFREDRDCNLKRRIGEIAISDHHAFIKTTNV
jgi:hypothetical protein